MQKLMKSDSDSLVPDYVLPNKEDDIIMIEDEMKDA
ncbi:hypothetical protein Tco_0927973, partial [Tanacetum coccineum]